MDAKLLAYLDRASAKLAREATAACDDDAFAARILDDLATKISVAKKQLMTRRQQTGAMQ